MSSRRSFLRRIIYLVVIGILLIPLHWLSQPATEATPGGKLAQLREQYHLSQAQLGEVDPTSVTIKLATLGLRGVAANLLWNKATDYKMRKDWTNLGATLNQITKVQPNFLNVWVNQAWNLSYNVSVEFDDYRERYRWVIKGFKFLNDGIKYNEGQPRLPWELGRYVSQKIGKADEVKQYRRLFAKDTDYRESLPPDLRDSGLDDRGRLDNWLVGKGWYEKAIDVVDGPNKRGPIGQSPLIYYSSAPMCQMNFAEAIEKDGIFGQVAKGAWATAGEEWSSEKELADEKPSYGARKIPTSLRQKDSDEPVAIRLNDQETKENEAKEELAQLDKLIQKTRPKLREEMIVEKKAGLTASQREAYSLPAAKRTPRQAMLAAQAEEALQLAPYEIASQIPGTAAQRKEAKEHARKAIEHQQFAAQIRGSRSVVNFDYWQKHAATEQEQNVLDARQRVYMGDRAYADDDMVTAYAAYEEGLKIWRKVLDAHKEYVADQTTCEDLMEMIKRYRKVLSQRGKPFPEPFILQDVIDSYKRQTGEAPPTPAPTTKESGKKPQSKPEVKKADARKATVERTEKKKKGGP